MVPIRGGLIDGGTMRNGEAMKLRRAAVLAVERKYNGARVRGTRVRRRRPAENRHPPFVWFTVTVYLLALWIAYQWFKSR